MKIPETQPFPEINLKKHDIITLENSLKIILKENKKLPKISFSLVIENQTFVQNDKCGIFTLCSALMQKGSKNIPKEKFYDEIDFIGGEFNISANGGDFICLSVYFEEMLKLFSEALLNPNFTEKELENERKKQLDLIKSYKNNIDIISQNLNKSLAYPKNHPYSNFKTEKTIKNIFLSDIWEFYHQNVIPNDAFILIEGDFCQKEVIFLIEKYFLSWKKLQNTTPQKFSETKNADFTHINFVDLPNAVQAQINIFNLQPLKMKDEDYFACQIMNHILGGDFSSYINMNLREKNSLTYGAHSVLPNNKKTESLFKITTKAETKKAFKVIDEVLKEVKNIQNQMVSDEKLEQAKSKYLGAFLLSTENPSWSLLLALNIITQDLESDFYQKYSEKISKITKEDILRVANLYIKPKNFTITIVGNKNEFISEENYLNLPIFYLEKENFV